MRQIPGILLAAIVAAVGSVMTTWAHGAEYSVTLLNFVPEGINNSGQITGTITGASGSTAVVWTPGPAGGTLTDLPNYAPYRINEGLAINSIGQVSGLGSGGNTPLWTPGAGGYSVTNIGDVNPLLSEDIWATGINDFGEVAGAGYDFGGGGGWTSFLWKPAVPNGTTGTMVSLGKLGGASSMNYAINSSGQLALNSNHALLWNPSTPNGTTGTFYDLGSLSGATGTSHARDINSMGQIVGESSVGSTIHAMLWTPDSPNGVTGSMIDLGTLPGDPSGSDAFAINSSGTVVGSNGINEPNIDHNAIIWTAGGDLQNLNDLLDQSGSAWQLTGAIGINDEGWIIGHGLYDPDGPGGTVAIDSSFLLIPVPEPASLWLMLLGAGALCSRKKSGGAI